MKTALILLIALLLGATLHAQTAKRATPASKPETQQRPVKILYDENFKLYYIADSATGKFIKALPQYKTVYQFSEGFAVVATEKGEGFINTNGTEIVPPNGKYNLALSYKGGFGLVGIEKDGKKTIGYINKSGALAIPMTFQDGMSFSEKLAAVKKNGKWGYINSTGALVIPAIYEDAGKFSFGLAAVSKKVTADNETSVKYGYIDKTGKQFLPFKFDEAGEFRNTGPDIYEAIATRGFVPMMIDKSGNEATSFTGMTDKMIVTSLRWLDEGADKVLVGINDFYVHKFGVYSSFATVFTVKPEYSEIQLTTEPNTGKEFYLVKKEFSGMGLVERFGDMIPAVYDYIQFNDTLIYAIDKIKVENDQIAGGAFSLYDLNLNRITKKEYDQITGFFDGLAKVKLGSKAGFINKKGEEVIPLIYDEAGNFSSGVVAVLKNDKVGAINTKGEVVIPFEYEDIGTFSDGYAYYQNKGLKGIIDSKGKKITETVFENMGNFSHGLAQFVKNSKVGFLNTKGEVVIEAKYDVAMPFADSLAIVSLDKKVGFIDLNGNVVIPVKYEDASDFGNGYAVVQENGKKYLINKKGVTVKTYE